MQKNPTVAILIGKNHYPRMLNQTAWNNLRSFATIIEHNDGEPATHGNGSTIGFAAADPAAADAWHAAGLANGGTTCEDPPGVREGTAGKLYLAYLRDPSGNKICALHRLA